MSRCPWACLGVTRTRQPSRPKREIQFLQIGLGAGKDIVDDRQSLFQQIQGRHAEMRHLAGQPLFEPLALIETARPQQPLTGPQQPQGLFQNARLAMQQNMFDQHPDRPRAVDEPIQWRLRRGSDELVAGASQQVIAPRGRQTKCHDRACRGAGKPGKTDPRGFQADDEADMGQSQRSAAAQDQIADPVTAVVIDRRRARGAEADALVLAKGGQPEEPVKLRDAISATVLPVLAGQHPDPLQFLSDQRIVEKCRGTGVLLRKRAHDRPNRCNRVGPTIPVCFMPFRA